MHERESPRAQIALTVTRKEYETACLLLSRRLGSLRALPAAILAAGLLLAAGFSFLGWRVSLFFPLLLCLTGLLILLVMLIVQPAAIRRQAAVDYNSYQALMETAVLRLYADEAETAAPKLTLTDSYALIVECVETPELLVLFRDRQRFLILPKRCLPPEEAEEILSFIRLVFARKRRVMRSFIW